MNPYSCPIIDYSLQIGQCHTRIKSHFTYVEMNLRYLRALSHQRAHRITQLSGLRSSSKLCDEFVVNPFLDKDHRSSGTRRIITLCFLYIYQNTRSILASQLHFLRDVGMIGERGVTSDFACDDGQVIHVYTASVI